MFPLLEGPRVIILQSKKVKWQLAISREKGQACQQENNSGTVWGGGVQQCTCSFSSLYSAHFKWPLHSTSHMSINYPEIRVFLQIKV